MRFIPLFFLAGGLLAAATTAGTAAGQIPQSPIDIPLPVGMNGKGGLQFNYPMVNLTVKSEPVKAGTLVNNLPAPGHPRHDLTNAGHPLNGPPAGFLNPPEAGRQINISTNGAPTLTVKGGPWKGTWKLDHMHFHQLSEHKFNGSHFDMEMHLVHYRVPDPLKPNEKEYLAVGRFIETVADGANDNAVLNDIFSNLNTIQIPLAPPPPHYVSGLLDLADLLPSSSFQSYRYGGSLTTGPPVSDTPVRWIVFDEPLGLTAAQIAAFRNHDSRGTVRKVWEPAELVGIGLPSHVDVQTVVPEPSTVWLLVTAGLVAARRRQRPARREI